MSDIKASPKAEAWILRTGHGTQVVEHKPPSEIDLWQPLYTEAALREQLKDCSAAFDRQQEMLDRNAEQIAVLCNLLSEAEAKKPWVGLTDEERDVITGKVIGFNSCVGWQENYAKAIETKLKEKNG